MLRISAIKPTLRTGTLLVSLILLSACASPDARFKTAPNLAMSASGPPSSAINNEQAARQIVVTMTDEFHLQLTGGKPLRQPNATPPRNYLRFLEELKQNYALDTVADWPLDSIGVRCFIFEVPNAAQRDQAIQRLRQDQRIETAQPMLQFSTAGESYNDPYLKLQPHFRDLGIKKSHRWATGKGISIAVIDTGADINHEDLKHQIEEQRNFVDSDAEVFNTDKHGTAINGVIAATTDNATGMSGIAPDARLLPMKACWQINRETDKARCSSFTLAKAINFAISNEVNIINLSLTGPHDPLLQRLIQEARKKHITVIAAVGADPEQNFPASVPGVFAVQAAEKNLSAQKLSLIVSAPGEKILSTAPQDQYDFFNGSSFAAAQLSGLIALIKERKPHISDDEIITTLIASVPVYRANDKTNISINACQVMAHLLETRCQF